jgi:hypothetical protein
MILLISAPSVDGITGTYHPIQLVFSDVGFDSFLDKVKVPEIYLYQTYDFKKYEWYIHVFAFLH